MSAPASSPPTVPQGWRATWSDQYSQWFYVDEKSGNSQWEHPSNPAPIHQTTSNSQNQLQHSYTSPPATSTTQPAASTDRGIMSRLGNLDPKAQTALAVGGGLAAGAFLEHEYDEHRHHHVDHHHMLGSVSNLIGAAGIGALGAKFFGRKGSATQQPQPQPQQPAPYYPPSPQPPYQSNQHGAAGYYSGPPPPVYGAQSPPPPASHGSNLGSLALGGAAGAAGGLAVGAASNMLHHNHSQDQINASGGGGGGYGVGPPMPYNNQAQSFSGPRLCIHAATYADVDVTDKVRRLVTPAQEVSIAKMVDDFGDPWPEAERKALSILYQYGERPMEVWCGSGNDSVDLRNEALSNTRMAFVNKDPGRIICLIWGQISILSEERVEKLEKDGELDCKDLGDGGFYPWQPRAMICYYRDEHGGVKMGHGREGGTMRLPWNPLAKWS